MSKLTKLVNQLKEVRSKKIHDTEFKFVLNFDELLKVMEEIDNLVGLRPIKDTVAKQFRTFGNNYKKHGKPLKGDKLNLLLCGPPGVGKTESGKLIAKFWLLCGCLGQKNNTPKKDQQEQFKKSSTQKITSEEQELIKVKHRINDYSAKAIEIKRDLDVLNRNLKEVSSKDKTVFQALRNIKDFLDDIENNGEDMITSGFVSLDKNVIVNITDKDIPSKIGVSYSIGDNKIETNVKENIKTESKNNEEKTEQKTEFKQENKTEFKQENKTESKEEKKYEPIFNVYTRADFVDQFQGWTPKKTRDLLEKNRGGVIMVDESYSLLLGSGDDFGMEACTEIVSFMTEQPDEIRFIFTGYKDQIINTLFKGQPGFQRRFKAPIDIKPYTPEELALIYIKQMEKRGYSFEDESKETKLNPKLDEVLNETKNNEKSEENNKKITKLFKENIKLFLNNGGSTEHLCYHTEDIINDSLWETIISGTFSKEKIKNVFNMDDIIQSIKAYSEEHMDENEEEETSSYLSMFA